MEFSQLIKQRYSVRKYKDIPVEHDKLLAVLEAARLAPSAVNKQPWHFVVFQLPEDRREVTDTYHREWIKKAPVIILICADHSQSWKRGSDEKDFADVDVAIAVDHMTLQAADLGLGTCWVCNFDAKRCAEICRMPLHIEPLVMLPLGYPEEEEVPEKKRKTPEEVIHWGEFRK